MTEKTNWYLEKDAKRIKDGGWSPTGALRVEVGERTLKVFKKRQGKLAREKFPFLLLPQLGSLRSIRLLSLPLVSFSSFPA